MSSTVTLHAHTAGSSGSHLKSRFTSTNSKKHSKNTPLAAKNRLPAIYQQAKFVADGGLMSYGAHEKTEHYRRVAAMVDKILKGAKPADLPVEQPDEVRIGDQSQSGQADRPDDSAQRAGKSGQGDQVSEEKPSGDARIELNDASVRSS